MESFVPSLHFPGDADLLERYRAAAKGQKIDQLGYGFVPFGYAAGQVLAQAVEGTKSLDPAEACRLHAQPHLRYRGRSDRLRQGRRMDQGAHFVHAIPDVAPGDMEQFADGKKQPVLWPPQYKTGDMIYPYADVKK